MFVQTFLTFCVVGLTFGLPVARNISSFHGLLLNFTMTDSKIKGNFVQLSTFKKWPTGSIIGYKTEEKDCKMMVTEIWCKVCARHSDKIKKDSRLKGRILTEIDKYVTGTTGSFITKHSVTVLCHLNESIAHKIAKEHKAELPGRST